MRFAQMFRSAISLLFVLGIPTAVFAATACEDLSRTSLSNTTITLAQTVAAGAFPAPAGRGGGGANPFATLPAFCRIQATLKPSADSDIRMELWMPVPAS